MGCLRLDIAKNQEPILRVIGKNLNPQKMYINHYPFGMEMPGRSYSSSGYRYGFQGQEKDDEIKGAGNSVNYKYRMHDVRSGRFFAVDPLISKYPHYSSYSFSGNKVIAFVELEGLEEYYAADGSLIGKVGTSTEIRILNNEYLEEAKKDIHYVNSKKLATNSPFIDMANVSYTKNLLAKNSTQAYIDNDDSKKEVFTLWAEKYRPKSEDKEYAMSLFTQTLTTSEGVEVPVFIPGTTTPGDKRAVNPEKSFLQIGGQRDRPHNYGLGDVGGNYSSLGWTRSSSIHTHPFGGEVSRQFSVEYGMSGGWAADAGHGLKFNADVFVVPYVYKDVLKLDINKLKSTKNFEYFGYDQMKKAVENSTSVYIKDTSK